MTQDEIIEMTRQAGGFDATPKFLERFAKLIAQHEREACAKVCENLYSNLNDDIDCRKRWPEQLRRNKIYADAIQTRGKS